MGRSMDPPAPRPPARDGRRNLGVARRRIFDMARGRLAAALRGMGRSSGAMAILPPTAIPTITRARPRPLELDENSIPLNAQNRRVLLESAMREEWLQRATGVPASAGPESRVAPGTQTVDFSGGAGRRRFWTGSRPPCSGFCCYRGFVAREAAASRPAEPSLLEQLDREYRALSDRLRKAYVSITAERGRRKSSSRERCSTARGASRCRPAGSPTPRASSPAATGARSTPCGSSTIRRARSRSSSSSSIPRIRRRRRRHSRCRGPVGRRHDRRRLERLRFRGERIVWIRERHRPRRGAPAEVAIVPDDRRRRARHAGEWSGTGAAKSSAYCWEAPSSTAARSRKCS